MKHAVTRVEIDASPAVVWAVLTDFERYPQWNPCLRFRGAPRAGQRVPMTVTLFGVALTVPVRIEEMSPERELRWRGGPGWLMHGTHYLRLEPIADERTRLTHGERFGGVLLPLLWPLLAAELLRFYERMNEGLRARCEAPGAQDRTTGTA